MSGFRSPSCDISARQQRLNDQQILASSLSVEAKHAMGGLSPEAKADQVRALDRSDTSISVMA